jgi:hypothetical protein
VAKNQFRKFMSYTQIRKLEIFFLKISRKFSKRKLTTPHKLIEKEKTNEEQSL